MRDINEVYSDMKKLNNALVLLRDEIKAIQDVCRHENVEVYNSSCAGSITRFTKCLDCYKYLKTEDVTDYLIPPEEDDAIDISESKNSVAELQECAEARRDPKPSEKIRQNCEKEKSGQ